MFRTMSLLVYDNRAAPIVDAELLEDRAHLDGSEFFFLRGAEKSIESVRRALQHLLCHGMALVVEGI